MGKNNNLLQLLILILLAGIFAGIDPALAAGGLDKVNTFVDNILTVLRGVSISVVTIAIIWAGYKFLFTRSEAMEILKILGGGLLIGGAAELAAYLLS